MICGVVANFLSHAQEIINFRIAIRDLGVHIIEFSEFLNLSVDHVFIIP